MERGRNSWFVSRPREMVKSKNDKVRPGAWKYIRGSEPDEYEALQRLEGESIWDPRSKRFCPKIYSHTNYE